MSVGLRAGKSERGGEKGEETVSVPSWALFYLSETWDLGGWTRMVPSSLNILDYEPGEKGQAGGSYS